MPMNAICLRKRVAFIAVGKNSNTTSPKHKVKLKYMNEVQPYSISLKECEYFFNIWYKITTKYMSCIKKSLITVKTLFHYDGWLWKINDIRSFYLSLSSTVDNICKIIYIMQNLNLECNMKPLLTSLLKYSFAHENYVDSSNWYIFFSWPMLSFFFYI